MALCLRQLRHGPQALVHKHDVHHGGLVEDDQIRFKGMLQSPLEPVGLGIELQDAMNGASLA